MAIKQPTPAVPNGAMEEFKQLTSSFEAELLEFVSAEIFSSTKSGKVDDDFEPKLKTMLEGWRDDAIISANNEFRKLYAREINIYTTYFKPKLKKKIVKPTSRDVYIKQLKAINEVAVNMYNTAIETVNQAALTSKLLQDL